MPGGTASRTKDGTRTERLGNRSSYTYQLEAFSTAVRTGIPAPALVGADDAVTTMRLIDQCYEASGMKPGRATDRLLQTTGAEPTHAEHHV